jgi:hypothetical protein
VAECARRAEAAVARIRSDGYDVVGAVDRLLVDPSQPGRRRPDEVADDEVMDAVASLVAAMLADVRELRRRT